MQINMVDVSSNNHLGVQPIDWAAVKASGVGAVMIKATEGTTYVNQWLDADAKGAQAAGLHVGYYHYAHPGQGQVFAQANSFWQHIKTLPRDIGVALDLEVQEGKSWAALGLFARVFLGRIPVEVKQKALYSNPEWLSHLTGAPWRFDLWIASWGLKPSQKFWAWQKTGSGTVPGIDGPVDTGVVNT